MKLYEIFKPQLSQMNRVNQELTYLLIEDQGYTTVKTILHWKAHSLLEKYKFVKGDQSKGMLPVFRE
jgi:hypothetical protein